MSQRRDHATSTNNAPRNTPIVFRRRQQAATNIFLNPSRASVVRQEDTSLPDHNPVAVFADLLNQRAMVEDPKLGQVAIFVDPVRCARGDSAKVFAAGVVGALLSLWSRQYKEES